MVGGAEGRVVVYCPGQSVGERLQRIVQQPHEGGVCGPGSFRFVTGGQGFGSGIPAVLESGEVAQRDRVQNAGRIRRRTWAGLRYAPSAPSSITKPTDSHKHWYIKRGQAMVTRCGRICLGKKKINFSQVFAGQAVGIKEVHDDIWLVSFMDYDLGYFDLETRVLEPLENPFGPKVLPMS